MMTRTIDVHEAAQLALTVEFPGLRRPQYVPLDRTTLRHWESEFALSPLTDEQVATAHGIAADLAGHALAGWARNG